VQRATVVFDLDGTLLHGDSAARLIRHLIGRQPVRRVCALLVAPVGMAMLRHARTRRAGVSLFFWIATFGLSEQALSIHVDQFLAAFPPQRIDEAIVALQADLDAGHEVIIATGAFEQLAERLVARLSLRGAPRVVGSTIRPWAGGFVAGRHANGRAKLLRMAECGVHPPFARAWSDSLADLPLLCAAGEAHWVTADAVAPEKARRLLPGLIVHQVGTA